MFLNKSLLRIGAIAAAICGLGGAALCFISPSLGGALIGLGVALGGGSFWALADLLAQQEDPQTYYREVHLHRKLAISLAYREKATLGTDLIIILRTAGRMFRA